jgi:hypothetical protein
VGTEHAKFAGCSAVGPIDHAIRTASLFEWRGACYQYVLRTRRRWKRKRHGVRNIRCCITAQSLAHVYCSLSIRQPHSPALDLWNLDRRFTEGLERRKAWELQFLHHELERSVRRDTSSGISHSHWRRGSAACTVGVESLALLVLGAAVADHIKLSPATDDLATFTDTLDRRADLHNHLVVSMQSVLMLGTKSSTTQVRRRRNPEKPQITKLRLWTRK